MNDNFLEPEFEKPYGEWKTKPTPVSTGALVRQMQPAIDRGISAFVGAGEVSPVLRSQAKQLAINALNTYNPAKAKLTTHVINHMQGLRRVNRQQQDIMHVPERVSLDQAFVARAESDLEEQLGRPPTIYELSDHAKLSPQRIKNIRSYKRPMQEGRLLAMSENEESSGYMPSVDHSDMNVVTKAVYDDLDPVGQNIMDWTLGLHGRNPMSNQQIAAKLKLTPGAVSQRKALIQQQLDTMHQSGMF